MRGGGSAWARPDAAAPPPAPADRLAVREDDTEQAHLMLGVPSVRRGDPRWAAQLVLSTVLGGGTSSRLFQEVRERRGLAYSVYSSTTGYSDLGVLSVYVGCAPERLGTAAGVLRTQLADLARDGVTEDELVRARGQLRGEYVLGLEDTSSRMSWLGRRELDGREASLDLADSLARIEAVTREDVATMAADLFATPVTAAVVGPYADLDDLPDELREVSRMTHGSRTCSGSGVLGARGRMGTEVCRAVEEADDLDLVAMVDEGDWLFSLADADTQVAVDFTHPSTVAENIRFCIDQNIHCVVGTSGITPEMLGHDPRAGSSPSPSSAS